MAANTTPIFTLTPHTSWVTPSVTANTAFDGTGTVSTAFTAGSNGSLLEDVYILPSNTNTDSVARFFVNNGNTNATASNNTLVHEESLPTYSPTQIAASTPIIWRANLVLQAGYKLNCCIGTSITGAIAVSCFGGDY